MGFHPSVSEDSCCFYALLYWCLILKFIDSLWMTPSRWAVEFWCAFVLREQLRSSPWWPVSSLRTRAWWEYSSLRAPVWWARSARAWTDRCRAWWSSTPPCPPIRCVWVHVCVWVGGCVCICDWQLHPCAVAGSCSQWESVCGAAAVPAARHGARQPVSTGSHADCRAHARLLQCTDTHTTEQHKVHTR